MILSLRAMVYRYTYCPIDHRGFHFPQTMEQIPHMSFPPRTPPPHRQMLIYNSTIPPGYNPDLNIDVSGQRDLSRQTSNLFKSVLPQAMHGNLQFLVPTPPPTSFIEDCDQVYSDGYSHPDTQIPDTNLEYFMPETERGIGAVFINETFPVKPKRPGVAKDREYLEKIFTMMRVKVDIFIDKSRVEMLSELEKFAKSANKSHFLLCIAFSTHGDNNDTIYSSDGREISLRKEIIPIFKPANCKALEGKPKVFIIQACRGVKTDYLGATPFADAYEKDELVSSETDFLISYACAPDYMAFRTEREGAWFLRELCSAYTTYSEKYHFVDILTLTNQRLMLRAKNNEEVSRTIAQPSHVESTLKKFLWLKFNSRITCNPLVTSHDASNRFNNIYCFDGPQALGSNFQFSEVPQSPMLSSSDGTPVNSRENTMETLKDDVYDWNNKDLRLGTLLYSDNKQFLKFDSPQTDCLPVYPLSKGDYSGLGIIIVNHVCGKVVREGSVRDLDNFRYIFEGLKLKVVVKENINDKTLLEEVGFEDFIRNEIEGKLEMDSFFLAISTHGEGESGLAGSNGVSIEVSSILSLLRVEKLAGKPKIVIIQACRGSHTDYQINQPRIEADNVPRVSTLETDLLVAYSCAHGYKAWRDDENGSWFVASLRRCYEKLKGRSNILELFTATTNYMLNEFVHTNEMGARYKQPAEVRYTLSALVNI